FTPTSILKKLGNCQCYEFGRVVGDGNFAVVRECRRRDNGQTLAIKIVERTKLIGREHMMQNELSLLGSLRHPRIVRLFAHHHTNTHSYLVMELVSGGDLFEAISDRGKFSEAEAGLMVSDVSEALNYIHCKSIVHRDLKPENLLVGFRVVRMIVGFSRSFFTICGTPTYVAPEILCETGYGVAVDVWALGVILYILVCGFPPFRSRNRDQVELFHVFFLCVHSCAEARGLIRALLQPDPTVRLTAEQTLLHPWVKAMASTCKQRALTDKTPRDTEATEGKPETVQKPPKTNTTESLTDKTRKRAINEENALKELGRQDERQTAMSSGRGQDKNKPAEQHLVEASHLSPQDGEHTPSEASTGQHKPEAASTDRRETQCPSPKLLNSKFNHLDSPTAAETELLPQIKTQAKQTRMQTPTGSTPPTNPSSTPASSLHQQNLTSAPQNHNKPDAHATTIAHPPTLS
uniref:non-specific serine/threonine protein kinase n=1 Tax=Maylandia zebra TaxID=106582 RepID=A0A3P9BC98_9CICH